jgi:hypothetical protein
MFRAFIFHESLPVFVLSFVLSFVGTTLDKAQHEAQDKVGLWANARVASIIKHLPGNIKKGHHGRHRASRQTGNPDPVSNRFQCPDRSPDAVASAAPGAL